MVGISCLISLCSRERISYLKTFVIGYLGAPLISEPRDNRSWEGLALSIGQNGNTALNGDGVDIVQLRSLVLDC